MGSFYIVVCKPISESDIEVFVGSKGIFVPEIIVEDSPKSFYFSVGLRTAYFGIFVYDIQFLKHNFKTMQMPRFPVMSGKFQPVIGK